MPHRTTSPRAHRRYRSSSPKASLRRSSSAHYAGSRRSNVRDIVALAAATPALRELVQLVQQADLVKALQAKGPFTVFAPTNAAFEKLFAQAERSDELAAQLRDPAFVKRVLTYHVVPGEVLAADILASDVPLTPKTLEKTNLCVYKQNGSVKVNNARVVKADVDAANGVVHLIDTVLVPNGECEVYQQ